MKKRPSDSWAKWEKEEPEHCYGYILSILLKALYVPEELNSEEKKLAEITWKHTQKNFEENDFSIIPLMAVIDFLHSYAETIDCEIQYKGPRKTEVS